MTHGELWIPFVAGDLSRYIFSEAWSDGYIAGVGSEALLSSGKLAEITEAINLLAGSPVFFDPLTQTYHIHEYDYLTEGYMDAGLEDDLCESAQKTADFIENGNFEAARNTAFGRMSFDKKIEQELGINTIVVSQAEAWKRFTHNTAKTLNDTHAALLLHAHVKDNKLCEPYHFGTSYFWNGEQFLTTLYHISSNTQTEIFIVPLVLAVYLNGKYFHDDYRNPVITQATLSHYLSERDKESLNVFLV